MIAEPLLPLARPVGDLKFLPGNPRRGDVAACKRSLKRFGQRKPIVVREDGTVEAGNTTLKAALELGWDQIACVAFGDDDATAKAFALADNRTSELGSFDAEALLAMASEVDAVDPELLLAASYDLAELTGTRPGKNDPDAVPEPPEEPVSQPGDLWLLGEHRLLCGDSTVATDVERLLGAAKPPLMVTDPPYGVDYDPNWRNEAADKGLIAHAARRVGDVANDDRVDWTDAWSLSPAHVAYCWHAGRHASSVQASLEAAGYEIRCQVIWAKSRFAISRGHYHWQHEPCWYATRKGHAAGWIGNRSQTTLWEINLDRNVEGGHSTQKPVECMERPIRNHKGDVYDPFGGSGTTLIAAYRTRRKSFLMEIEPPYCDVICRRFQEHTGCKPVLEATGEPHDFT